MSTEGRRSTRTRTSRSTRYDYGPCPSQSVAQEKHFFPAGDSKLPLFNSGRDHSQYFYPPTRIRALHFVEMKWQKEPRPAHYLGLWPPTSASQLMSLQSELDTMIEKRAMQFCRTFGKPVITDCLGKYCWQEVGSTGGFYCHEEFCDHTLSEWLTGAEGWEERFELRSTPGMGYGLHSKQRWEKDDILGAYLGELIPQSNANSEYCHEVFVGPEFKKTGAKIAYIDAENYGNYTRFCNHSCEYNAVISERRVGKERVLALTAIKTIAAGEQITIDYGTDYFQNRPCLCRSVKCMYPDAMNPVVVFKAKNPRIKKTGGQVEKDSTVRYDSVLQASDESYEMDID